MNPILATGTVIVTFALISYSVFIFVESRQSALTALAVGTLTLGVCLDITSTTVMIIGSRNIPITVHGVLGYAALTGMLIDAILIWRHWRGEKRDQPVSRPLNVYTRLAYGWWVFAYIAGALLAAFALR